jgi:hypothetical protein
VTWFVVFHPEAETEVHALPVQERVAVAHAVEKRAALGPRLPYPHQSEVRDGDGVRELRPRAGRSPWRAFYRRVGMAFVVAAVGPEAGVDGPGFRRAVRLANKRLSDVGQGGDRQ